MAFVAAAYVVVAGLFFAYVLTLAARQRLIAEMADAVIQQKERS